MDETIEPGEKTLERRVGALERAITDGEQDIPALIEDAESLERIETVEQRLCRLEETVAELEAATQALRGYVGNIRAVNREVEQRADAALAKVQTLESRAGVDGPVEAGQDPAEQSDSRPSVGERATACTTPDGHSGEMEGEDSRTETPIDRIRDMV